jgi:mono/diheme cytochrome c family protein
VVARCSRRFQGGSDFGVAIFDQLEFTIPTVIVITFTGVILGALALSYGFLSSEGLSSRKKPSNFEYAIANYALGLSIPSEAKKLTSPVSSNPEVLIDAKKSYSDSCAVCHGIDGTGKTKVASGLSPEVPDLHAEHIQKLTDGEMFYIIKNGVRFTGMPGWDFRDQQIWNLVFLIRQFAKDNPASPESRKST